ncbi:NAD+ diphosphatase [Deinococcus metalli]|uniref:NAD(+) diphosphatase n=1 Tax=Deinococcus metalli TaxID=1141878 RepID=A0A7W8KCS3_9DEIO|nr:NAD(+) diphosphatase [Deinococcus metalli]MBB5375328.1 NAD+ diphosphatase [Deinococcus metalli]GHF30088.1 NADH pyrophosphatase [Deinococcus metalli]
MNATSLPDTFIPDRTLVPDDGSVWVVFDGPKLVLTAEGTLPASPLPVVDVTALGTLDGRAYFAAGLDGALPDGFTSIPLRAAFGKLSEAQMGVAGYGSQLVDYVRTHRYCGRCATPLVDSGHERSRTCPNCGLTVYPRVAPVAMVLIHRGKGLDTELLLARGPHFAPGVYSALAGFVEPSETLEHAAHREVQEEVGVTVTNLTYVLSQPWPFPHSLMVGFDAEYVGGDIVPQPGEIEDARWFPVTALPLLPGPFSIARQLIDRAAERALHGADDGAGMASSGS